MIEKPKPKYGKLPHDCKKETLVYTYREIGTRNYKRSRHTWDEYHQQHDWYQESRKRPGRWRKLDRFSENGDETDYHLALDLEAAWRKMKETSSDSAEPEEGSKTDERYSKFGLDKQGREKFETVKLKQGNKLYFSFNLKEQKTPKDGLHWLRFFIHGQQPRYCFDEKTTLRFVKRVLVGLSQRLLLKAIEYGKEVYDERRKTKRPL
jgi:hypothetical protein